MTKYSPVFIIIHWFSALLIIIQIFISHLITINFHILLGFLLAALTSLRFILKLSKTNIQDHSVPQTNIIAEIAHYMIYALLFILFISGTAMASGLLSEWQKEVVIYLHQNISDLLGFLIITHICAVLFHSFIRKKPVFQNMWFSKPSTTSTQ